MRRRFCFGLLLCGLLMCAEAIHAQKPNGSQAAKELVTQLEHRLNKKLGLAKRGFASAAQVDELRAELLKAKHDLASIQGDRKEACQHNAELFELRQRELRRLEQLKSRGQKSELPLAKARRRVATCRYIIAEQAGKNDECVSALKDAVVQCELETELRKAAVAKFHTTQVELSLARNRLACGRNLLAKEDGRPEEIEKQFQSAVDLLQADFDNVTRLRERGIATVFEQLFSRSNLLNAQVRLANAKGRNDTVEGLVEKLVDTNQQLLNMTTKPSSLSFLPVNLKGTLQSGIAKDLERDRRRLRALKLGSKISDDLSIATLGL